jgi:hypothetical protein
MEQRTSRCRGCAVRVGVLPLLKQRFRLFDQLLVGKRQPGERLLQPSRWECAAWHGTHPLLSRLCDIPVGLEQTTKVQRLSAPKVSVDAPVEGELEGAPVEASAQPSVAARSGRYGRGRAQDVYSGAHGGSVRGCCCGCGREVDRVWPQCVVVVVVAGSVVVKL